MNEVTITRVNEEMQNIRKKEVVGLDIRLLSDDCVSLEVKTDKFR